MHYDPVAWPAGVRRQLAPFSGRLTVDFAELLDQRQTRRKFGVPVSEEQLGWFLWLACHNRSLRQGPFGTPQESRPHPSAGGMHPIHVLAARAAEPWFRYEPVGHALVEIPGTESAARNAREAANELVSLQQGILLGLVAEPGKTGAKYENHASLVWRDAGVVLGYLSLVAEAMQLSFCPLGLCGDFEFGSAVWGPGHVHGAGLAILGAS